MKRTRTEVVKDEIACAEGMVVGQHPLIAEAGAELLADGGNAMDAAVAAAFAAGVVEPFMSGLGGGGTLIVHDPATNQSACVEWALRVPALARADMFDVLPAAADGMFGLPAVEDAANRIGWRAPLVPGAGGGLALALERFGTRPLRAVMAPAIRLAREGFAADWYHTLNVACAESELRRFPSTVATYMPQGFPPRARLGFGEQTDMVVQPDLADTLEEVAAEGPRAFYHGRFATTLDRAMREHGGSLRADDLARYQPVIYDRPMACQYRGRHTVLTAPGPMSGVTLVEMLQILEGLDLSALGHNSPDALHLLAETMRRAYVDRFAYLADPDYADVPFDGLMSPEFAAERRATIDPRRADPTAGPGDPWPFQGGRGALRTAAALADGSCTTHLCAADRNRMLVSLTNTNGELWGSRVVIPGTGVLLNNGMGWFDPRPGSINSISPLRRALNNMSPAVILRDGQPWMAIGAPGGRKIVTAVLQGIVNLVDFGLGPQASVGAPRVHSEGPITEADSRLPDETIQALRDRGHNVSVLEDTYAASNFARLVAIQVDEAAGLLRGGAHLWQPATVVGL